MSVTPSWGRTRGHVTSWDTRTRDYMIRVFVATLTPASALPAPDIPDLDDLNDDASVVCPGGPGKLSSLIPGMLSLSLSSMLAPALTPVGAQAPIVSASIASRAAHLPQPGHCPGPRDGLQPEAGAGTRPGSPPIKARLRSGERRPANGRPPRGQGPDQYLLLLPYQGAKPLPGSQSLINLPLWTGSWWLLLKQANLSAAAGDSPHI